MICIRNIHWTWHGSHLASGFLVLFVGHFLIILMGQRMHSSLCEFGNNTGYITKTSICKIVWKFSLYFSHISWKPIPLHAFKFFFFLDNTVAFPLNLCVNISASSASDNLVPYLMTLRCKDLRRKKLKDQLPIDNVLYWIIREKRR